VTAVQANVVHFRRYGKKGDTIPIESVADGWAVRDRFLEIKTAEDLRSFLDDFGQFRTRIPEGTMTLTDVLRWQAAIRWLLSTPPRKWGWIVEDRVDHPFSLDKHGKKQLDYGPVMSFGEDIYSEFAQSSRLAIRFQWATRLGNKGEKKGKEIGQQKAYIMTEHGSTAILATIYVDHLRNAEFGICARKDCLKPYEITSKRKRKYCGNACAHLVGMRRTRAKKKSRTRGKRQ
jgi:hypothetical protein